jgi:ABC-2 type transport system ATP-binding protein
VLLSSHILHEVEKVCDTVTIIRNGTSVESGTLDELRHLTRSNVTAVVSDDPSAVGGLAGVHNFATAPADGGTRVTFDVDNAQVGSAMSRLTALGLHSLTAAPPSLEELFMRHYGDVLPGAESAADGADDTASAAPTAPGTAGAR